MDGIFATDEFSFEELISAEMNFIDSVHKQLLLQVQVIFILPFHIIHKFQPIMRALMECLHLCIEFAQVSNQTTDKSLTTVQSQMIKHEELSHFIRNSLQGLAQMSGSQKFECLL